MEKLIVIIGPTAVGKTRLSIDVAHRLNTEIISGNSMQIYSGMNIGTAKASRTEQEGIPHHLIDIIPPTGDFSVVDFQNLAAKQITDLNQQNKIPILCGGTGLYIKALLEGYIFHPAPGNDSERRRMEAEAEMYGNQYLHDRLATIAPHIAKQLHPNDRNRIIRALETHTQSGEKRLTGKKTVDGGLMYEAAVIGLMMERHTLYERINQRVDQMVHQGLLDEVSDLLASGVSPDAQSMQAIGYKEIVAHLQGKTDLDTAISRIKQSTRHFAKRQITWYKKMSYIQWFQIEHFADYDQLLEAVYRAIAGKFHFK
ncbi:MAG: tRNA (adenosine(37)-N6)-dimethylallyltransferase MiaA [Negativicutes bacterium]